MSPKKTKSDPDKLRKLVQDERRRQAEREQGYRARA
ncbi:MAG: HNH endonuclease, partial [Deltaproteobacteria bacterium]|nr:HNH endonuclease [Deltaproteobacteria bacterium]